MRVRPKALRLLRRRDAAVAPAAARANRPQVDPDQLIAIPGLGVQDVAMIASLLEGAGFVCRVHQGFGKGSRNQVLIRQEDLVQVKEFLSDYRISDASGTKFPIPW